MAQYSNMGRSCGAVVILVVLAAPASGFEQVAAVGARAVELMQWIGENSDFDVSDLTPPLIEFRSRAEMADMLHMEAANADDWPLALQGGGIIFLQPDFRPGRDDWMLLHELVHYVQQEADIDYRCPQLAERAAYELQVKFSHQYGGRIPSDLFVRLLTCPF